MSRRGSALLIAIVAILLVSGLVIPLVGLTARYRKATFLSAQDERALAVAEAGASAALLEIQNERELALSGDGNSGIGNVQGTLGDGSFEVTISPPYTGINGGPYEITALGTVQDAAHGIKVTVEAVSPPGGQNPFDWWSGYPGSIFSGRAPSIGSVSNSRSYNSKTDPDANVNLSHGNVRSNEGIVLGSSSKDIYGDATPGPGYSVSITHWTSSVSGSTAPAATVATPPLPTIPDNPHTIPTNPTSVPPIPGSNDNLNLVPSGYYNAATKSLTVPGWATANLPGGSYVLDSFSVGSVANVTFTGDTTLYIPATKLMSIGSSAEFNCTGNLTIVAYGNVNYVDWVDSVVAGNMTVFTAAGGSFSTGGVDDIRIGGSAKFISDGSVAFGQSDRIVVGGNAEQWVGTGGSLTVGDWVDYDITGDMRIVADGPVSYGQVADVIAGGSLEYYFDDDSSFTVQSSGELSSGGDVLMVSKAPINFTDWSNMTVNENFNIWLDPGSSLTFGAVADLTMNGNLSIVSHGGPDLRRQFRGHRVRISDQHVRHLHRQHDQRRQLGDHGRRRPGPQEPALVLYQRDRQRHQHRGTQGVHRADLLPRGEGDSGLQPGRLRRDRGGPVQGDVLERLLVRRSPSGLLGGVRRPEGGRGGDLDPASDFVARVRAVGIRGCPGRPALEGGGPSRAPIEARGHRRPSRLKRPIASR